MCLSANFKCLSKEVYNFFCVQKKLTKYKYFKLNQIWRRVCSIFRNCFARKALEQKWFSVNARKNLLCIFFARCSFSSYGKCKSKKTQKNVNVKQFRRICSTALYTTYPHAARRLLYQADANVFSMTCEIISNIEYSPQCCQIHYKKCDLKSANSGKKLSFKRLYY